LIMPDRPNFDDKPDVHLAWSLGLRASRAGHPAGVRVKKAIGVLKDVGLIVGVAGYGTFVAGG
jgi:hypothetical protein